MSQLYFIQEIARESVLEEEKSGGARQCAWWGCAGSEEGRAQARGGERAESTWLLLLYVIFPPSGPALCKLGLARSAVGSSCSPHWGPRTFFILPLFYFPGLFPSLSFSHRHFGLLFPILST